MSILEHERGTYPAKPCQRSFLAPGRFSRAGCRQNAALLAPPYTVLGPAVPSASRRLTVPDDHGLRVLCVRVLADVTATVLLTPTGPIPALRNRAILLYQTVYALSLLLLWDRGRFGQSSGGRGGRKKPSPPRRADTSNSTRSGSTIYCGRARTLQLNINRRAFGLGPTSA